MEEEKVLLNATLMRPFVFLLRIVRSWRRDRRGRNSETSSNKGIEGRGGHSHIA